MPSLSAPAAVGPLAAILENKVLSWAEEDGMNRVLIAEATRAALEAKLGKTPLPAGMRISDYPRSGPRLVNKGKRFYHNASIETASWPDDRQQQLRVPVLCCVVSGEADLAIGDYILHCREGHILFLPADVPHPDGTQAHFENDFGEHRHGDLMWLSPWMFGQCGMECWICHSRGERHWNLDAGESAFFFNQTLFFTFQTLMDEAVARNKNNERICHYLLLTLVSMLVREIKRPDLFQPGKFSGHIESVVDLQDPITRAQDYVRSHLNKPLTIDAVAHHIYMSRAQFTRRFRRETGETFNTFVTAQRIAEAKRLLQDSDWSIQMICRFVGLKPTQFRDVFTRHTGLSPTEFRRQSVKNEFRYHSGSNTITPLEHCS